MIDISDGIAADLKHMCDESRCGAVLRAEAIPISPAAPHIKDERSALEHALGDGEDFELLFAISAEEGGNLIQTQPVSGITLTHVGECIAEPGLFLEERGQRSVLKPLGYVHSF